MEILKKKDSLIISIKLSRKLQVYFLTVVKRYFYISLTVNRYILIIYGIQVSLLSGGDSNLQTMAFKIGRQLGKAFQLVDDILDFSASSAQLGKPSAVDMSQGL